MSNKQKNIENEKLEILISNEFPIILREKNLLAEEHNILLSAHIVALGFSTVGISSGGANVTYYQNLSDGEDFKRANSGFYFFTTKNGLIENSLRCTNSTVKMKNKLFSFNNSRDLKNFMIEYWLKNSKIYVNSNRDYFPSGEQFGIQFNLNGVKRKSQEGLERGYSQIIKSNPLVKSFVDMVYMEKSLKKEIKKESFKNKI